MYKHNYLIVESDKINTRKFDASCKYVTQPFLLKPENSISK